MKRISCFTSVKSTLRFLKKVLKQLEKEGLKNKSNS